MQALNSSQTHCFNDNIIADDARTFVQSHFSYQIGRIVHQNCPKSSIASNVVFRGITYKKNQVVCYDVDDFGQYLLCRITILIINDTFDNLSFLGERLTVMCNDDTGLFYEIPGNNISEDKTVFLNFDNLLSHEPLLQHQNSKNIIEYC